MASANVVLAVGQMSEFMNVYRRSAADEQVSSTVSQMVDTKAARICHSTDALSGSSPSSLRGRLTGPGGQKIAVNGVSIRASAVNTISTASLLSGPAGRSTRQ